MVQRRSTDLSLASQPSRSAYAGMVVAAPIAAAAWLLVLGGVLWFF